MLSELRYLWRIIRTAILVIGVLLSFLALVEVLHVYVVLRDAYSPLGYAFLLLITRDVLRIVATVNYMNYGQKVTEQLISSTPLTGRTSGEIAQGFGAGLLTSVAGHSAIYRCSAYRPWNKEIAVQTMSIHAKTFMNDVSNILIQDIFPLIKNKLFSTIPTEQIQKMIYNA